MFAFGLPKRNLHDILELHSVSKAKPGFSYLNSKLSDVKIWQENVCSELGSSEHTVNFFLTIKNNFGGAFLTSCTPFLVETTMENSTIPSSISGQKTRAGFFQMGLP